MKSFIFICIFQLGTSGYSSCANNVHIYYGIACIIAGEKLGLYVFPCFSSCKKVVLEALSF